jgi:hypothetical protein
MHKFAFYFVEKINFSQFSSKVTWTQTRPAFQPADISARSAIANIARYQSSAKRVVN